MAKPPLHLQLKTYEEEAELCSSTAVIMRCFDQHRQGLNDMDKRSAKFSGPSDAKDGGHVGSSDNSHSSSSSSSSRSSSRSGKAEREGDSEFKILEKLEGKLTRKFHQQLQMKIISQLTGGFETYGTTTKKTKSSAGKLGRISDGIFNLFIFNCLSVFHLFLAVSLLTMIVFMEVFFPFKRFSHAKQLSLIAIGSLLMPMLYFMVHQFRKRCLRPAYHTMF